MIEFVIRCLLETRGTHKKLAVELGIPYGTIRRIITRETKNPGVKSVELLHNHFVGRGFSQSRAG